MSKRIASVATTLAAIGILASSANAQITKQAKGYLFRLKFTKGQTVSYSIRTTVSNGTNISSPVKMKVLNVKNGFAELESVVGPMSVNGKPGKARTTRVTVDSRGGITGDPSMSGAFVGLPAGPIAVGSSWKSAIPIPGGQNIAMNATYKFVGIKNVKGKQLAQLNVTIESPIGSGKGTTFLNVSDGMLSNSTMSMGAQGLTMTATVTRK